LATGWLVFHTFIHTLPLIQAYTHSHTYKHVHTPTHTIYVHVYTHIENTHTSIVHICVHANIYTGKLVSTDAIYVCANVCRKCCTCLTRVCMFCLTSMCMFWIGSRTARAGGGGGFSATGHTWFENVEGADGQDGGAAALFHSPMCAPGMEKVMADMCAVKLLSSGSATAPTTSNICAHP